MELDADRSGNFNENKITLLFTGVDIGISIDLDSEDAKELQRFLNELMDQSSKEE